MKITIESTTKIVHLNNVPARVWEGKTESGIEVICFVTRIAVSKDKLANQSQFEKELMEQLPPSAEVERFPLRMII